MKTCFKCLTAKPLTAFYKHAMMADGHLNKCKECTKTDVKKHRQDNWQYVRDYDRLRASQPHRVAKAKEIQTRWKAQHPERRAAQLQVQYALRKGTLQKTPCMVCGDKAESHHPDYSRPLDVVWLCPAHHKQAHALVSVEQFEDVAT
jgi:hypothetical protein